MTSICGWSAQPCTCSPDASTSSATISQRSFGRLVLPSTGSSTYCSVGQPTAGWKQPITFCSTSPSSGMNCATRARLSGPAARVSTAARCRGKRIRLRRRVVVDDSAGDDAAEPLPHVAFVQPGGVGDLRAGGRGSRRACRTACSGDRSTTGWPVLAASIAATIRSANRSVVSGWSFVRVVMTEKLYGRERSPHRPNDAFPPPPSGENDAETHPNTLLACAHDAAAVREDTPSLA